MIIMHRPICRRTDVRGRYPDRRQRVWTSKKKLEKVQLMEREDNMVFRKAKQMESEVIMNLYRSVMGTPFCTWNESYPGESEIDGDLASGFLYVLEQSGKLIGAISIVPENELDDFTCWKVKENVREFARVVLEPDYQKKGLSVNLVEGVMREFQKQCVTAVHIADAKDNIPAQKLYRKMGFEFLAETDLYGHRFLLCEKIL